VSEHATDQGAGLIAGYDAGAFFDEMIDASGAARPHHRALYDRLAALTDDGLQGRIRTANAFFPTQGIGFTVYGDQAGTDQILPFDLIPRIGDAGWLSLDPTHDTEQTEHYVRVGAGRDYADVPPSRGVYKGIADETLEVAVTIREP
jgi:hypothetical protein